MKKSYFIALVIALAACIWVISGILVPSSEPKSEQEPAIDRPDEKVLSVRVRDVIAEAVVNDVIITGRTRASRRVTLRAETAGQVAVLLVEKGADVREGDVIARLEVLDRKVRVSEAKGRVRQRDIEYRAARALENKGFNSRIRGAQALADLEAAKAELKKAEIDLENIAIRAPFDGVIYGQDIEVGDYVSVGDSVYTIVDLDPVKLVGFVTERYIGSIRTGVKAQARLVNGADIEGIVTYVAPAADTETRTFEVEISVPNPDDVVVEGMTAEIHIPLPKRKAHKISPSILALDDEGRIGVKIVDAEHKVRFYPVTIVADAPDHMWVEGLPEKVRIITVGQEFAVPGQVVRPVLSEGDGLL